MDIRPDTKAAFAQVKEPYRRTAVFLLDVALVFLLANLVVDAVYRVREALRGSERQLGLFVARHGLEKVARAYPGWDRRDLVGLLEETTRTFENEYEPFTDFRVRSFAGRFVNVSKHGYRLVKDQGPWPPERTAFNVFVFGGSTTFGMGLPDDRAIPSLLGEQLPGAVHGRRLRVYNLGRPGYISAQERVLFESLLVHGATPDIAVFIDGLNDFYIWPRPLAADVMRQALAKTLGPPHRTRLGSLLAALPLGRLVLAVRHRLFEAGTRVEQEASEPIPPERVIADWRANRRLIEAVSRAHGVRSLFVWQPIPFYQYDLRYHLFVDPGARSNIRFDRLRLGYESFERVRSGSRNGDNFLWLANIQAGFSENLYVSEFHYGSVLNDAIAARIARHLMEGGWLSRGTWARAAGLDRLGPAQ